MKLRTLLVLCPSLLAATLAFAAATSASEVFPAPSDDWKSVKLLDVGTGKELGHWVPAQSDTVIEMEVETGRVLRRIQCDEWQDASAPEGCEGHVVSMVPYRPAQLPGVQGLL